MYIVYQSVSKSKDSHSLCGIFQDVNVYLYVLFFIVLIWHAIYVTLFF